MLNKSTRCHCKLLTLFLVTFLGFHPTCNKTIFASNTGPQSKQRKVLLFIHGIFGNSEGTWQDFPTLVKQHPSLTEYFVSFYEYPSAYLCFRPWPAGCTPSIEELADALRTQINNHYRAYEDVVLVTHSLGGLIAMKYLEDEVESKRKLRVRKIVLFAVPISGSEAATVARALAPWHMRLLEELSRGSQRTQELGLKWLRLNMERHIRAKYVLANQDELIDKSQVKILWGDVEAVNRGHMDIVKPKDTQDDSFIILLNFLAE